MTSQTNQSFVLNRVQEQGFNLVYRVDGNVSSTYRKLVIQAFHSDELVAEADFSDSGSYAHCQNIRVEPGYRRKGLATAIYVFAEQVFGRPLSNFWSGDQAQSMETIALWSQPDRPFGRK